MIAGVDLSSFSVDIVKVGMHESMRFGKTNPPPDWIKFDLSKRGDAFERARRVRHVVRSWVWGDVEAVGIEDPRGINPGPIFRVQGAVLSSIPQFLLVQPWVPSAWRKTVGLKGNAPKEEIAEFVRNRLGPDLTAGWTQDAFDAWCIAEATRVSLTSGP